MGRNILQPRESIKPWVYPQLLEYKDSIRHAYWIHTEYNLKPDVQDYKVNTNDVERGTLTRAILGVSQIEVKVKRFWGDLFTYIPQFEIDHVGATFADSEVRHFDAYSHILDILNLNTLFETVGEIPAIRDRYNYLEKALSKDATTPVDIAIRVILFAELIERVSLFGLFYLIMSFNKRQNTFKGLSNIVEATTKEEEIHGAFGVEIFNILKEENPYIGESSFIEDTLKNIFIKAEKAEMKILDWVFEEGDLEHVTKEEVMNFVKLRFNEALVDMDIDFRFETDPELTEKNMWFYEELLSTKEKDFFNKRVTDYSKGTRSVSKDDLF